MIDAFINYLQFEKRFSKNTAVSYKTDLLQFNDFLTATYEEKNLANATHSMIRSWVVSLVDQKLDPASINRKIASLRSLYTFLLKQEVIPTNPTSKIKQLKTAKRLPHFVLENDMQALLDNQPSSPQDISVLRGQLIIELLYGTGMRLSSFLKSTIRQEL
jgi:integrase/recombinase XerC